MTHAGIGMGRKTKYQTITVADAKSEVSKAKAAKKTSSAPTKEKYQPKKILAVPCPTCGAAPKEKCELASGQPRGKPHRDRRLIAAD
jgi:hypothetical protein